MSEKNESYAMFVKRAEESKARAKAAAEALDNAILTDPSLSHKTRLVLIELQGALRHQALTEELLALELEHLHRRIDIVIDRITKH